MIRIFLALCAASALLIKIDAQLMCPVGESGEAVGGFCNEPQGDEKCKTYCTKKFAAELLQAACSAERPGTKKRECICTLKCASGGCAGDPHCWSFDNARFGYQGTKKHYIVKPCKALPTLPEFEVILTNKPWGGNVVSVVDTVDLIVPDWGQVVEIAGRKEAALPITLTVNRKPQTIPFRFSQFIKHREDFIDIKYSDPQQVHLVIVTSFGLRITFSSIPVPGAVGVAAAYGDLSVDIPRHPELRGNTCGIFGRWNDDPSDDNLDPTGKPHPLADPFSPGFGDSWIVKGGGLPSQCEIDLARLAHDDHVKNFNKDHKRRLKKMCQENLEQAELLSCMKGLDRPPHAIDDCVLDLSFIEDEDVQNEFLEAMVAKFIHACPEHKIKFKEPTNTCCLDNLVPLFRFNVNNEHIFTIYQEEVLAINKAGWTYQGIEARVAVNGGDLHCNPDGLKPIYRLAGGPKGGDRFYTASLQEAKDAAAKLSYVLEGQEFFCATEKGESGATLPLFRYLRVGGTVHFYTTSLEKGNQIVAAGGKAEGILCYVWPRAPRGPENVSHKIYPAINP